jgi:hypothetical protein
MNQASAWSPGLDRHVQRRQREFSSQMIAHRPADDLAAV